MNVKDAATALGVSTGRVRQMLGDGSLKGEKLTERGWAISLAEVRAAKHRREVKQRQMERKRAKAAKAAKKTKAA